MTNYVIKKYKITNFKCGNRDGDTHDTHLVKMTVAAQHVVANQ